jgi:SET domain-containing protein
VDDFYALRDIAAGEEILIDYNELSEPEDKKDAFYTRSRKA